MISRRLLATSALVLIVAGTALLVIVAIGRMPRGLASIAIVIVAAWLAGSGIVRRGASRTVRLLLAVALLVGVVVITLTGEARVAGLVAVTLMVVGLATARRAFRVHARWPSASRPTPPCRHLERQGGGWKGSDPPPRGRGEEARDRADRAAPGPRPRAARPRCGGGRGRRTRGGRRRRNASARGRHRGRARPPVRVHPRRHPQPFRTRSRRRPRRRGRSARRLRQRHGARGRPRGGQRQSLRQQRLTRALRARRSSARATGTPSCAPSWTPPRMCSHPRATTTRDWSGRTTPASRAAVRR